MRKVKTGVIGTGRLGMEHARNLAGSVPNAELVAVCNRDEARAAQAAQALGIAKSYGDAAKLCNDEEVEAVVIVTNTDSHTDMIKLALDAGRHVFCEKPLADTVEKCKAAEEAVAAHKDLVFQLGFHRRFDPTYVRAAQLVREGAIGDIVLVRSSSQDPAAIIEGALAYGPKSGGVFLDLAIHDIDMVRYLTNDEPDKLFAVGGAYAYPQFAEWGDGDNVSCLMHLKGGAMAYLFAGRSAAHGTQAETEIVGTKGSLNISHVPADTMLEIMDEGGVRRECYQDFLTRWHEAYIAELTDFCDNVIHGRQGSPNVTDGTRATALAIACKESFLSGKLMEV